MILGRIIFFNSPPDASIVAMSNSYWYDSLKVSGKNCKQKGRTVSEEFGSCCIYPCARKQDRRSLLRSSDHPVTSSGNLKESSVPRATCFFGGGSLLLLKATGQHACRSLGWHHLLRVHDLRNASLAQGLHIAVSIHLTTSICVYLYIYVYYICIYIYMYTHMIYVYIYMYIYMCVSLCLPPSPSIYTHIHKHLVAGVWVNGH